MKVDGLKGLWKKRTNEAKDVLMKALHNWSVIKQRNCAPPDAFLEHKLARMTAWNYKLEQS